MKHFTDRMANAVRRCKTPVLVGLDPRQDCLPAGLLPEGNGDPQQLAARFETFCREVIDVVAPLVAAVKPQAAFFEQIGPDGMCTLAKTIQYASDKGLIVILDGKRNDIGSTAMAYALGWLGRQDQSPWGADALTVNPYLGDDSLTPFVEVAQQRSAGLYVLVKTSNAGSATFQDVQTDGQPLYRKVAAHVEQLASETVGEDDYGLVGAVVGATYPEQLAELREQMPHTWFLVPGFGSQGGTAADVAGAFDPQGLGAIVNNSRGIIFAYDQPKYRDRFGSQQWQGAVEAATRDMIDVLRTETPAGRLGVS